jgi:2-succinyl-5-enolpyruvyl-6-hydroxy-3-cyclohexene-1-carboxylate synthase
VNGSSAVAAAVVAALERGGVTDVVLAPGSRSAALALAVHEADAQGRLRLHVRIDERTAGFLALGLAKGGHRPAAVVTTSGTAVANLHPAVLEAVHMGERLIVVSADRPAQLRGTGANQTTEQAGIFGPRVAVADLAPGATAAVEEAVDTAVRRQGPSQLNLQFAEPLLPDGQDQAAPSQAAHRSLPTGTMPAAADPDRAMPLDQGPRTVVVAGDDAGPPARLMAQGANWPLLAEPTSGARTGTHALRTYRLLLGGDLAGEVERVVVTGHPTLSRPVTALISRGDVDVISVRGPGGVCTDPGRVARHVDAMPKATGAGDDGWMQRWRAADVRASQAVDELAMEPLGLPLAVAAEVAKAVTAEALLVVGSSQPVRDLDVMAPVYPAGERRRVIGNRGLSGIDGTVSTAIGAALARQSSRSLAYVGDLTFLHDVGALVLGPDEPRPDLTVVVANDDGGAIFATLEQGAAGHAASFERVFGTPHRVSLRDLCAATGTAYERADDPQALRALLAVPPAGVRVVEVPVDRSLRRALAARLARIGSTLTG